MRVSVLITAVLSIWSGETVRAADVALETQSHGSLYWVFSDRLDLAGETGVALWLPPRLGWRPGVALDSQTAIERASGLTFAVRTLSYRAEFSARSEAHPWLTILIGQRGQGRVDAEGYAYVRYAGIGLAASGARWRSNATLGAVLQDRNVDANGLLRAQLEGWAPLGKLAIGISARLELIHQAGQISSDYSIGPQLLFGWSRTQTLALFARYQHAGSPLGLEASGWQAGFEIATGDWDLKPRDDVAVLSGALMVGIGASSRHYARLDLRATSPPFLGATRALIEVDANVLTADDTNDLYYFVWLGAERPWRSGMAAAHLYHRSDHRWADAGAVRSTNFIEFGGSSRGWREPPSRRGAWDASLFGGLLIDSDFGEDRRELLRGGVRWALPWAGARWLPYVKGEGEYSDADRHALTFGVERDSGLSIELSQRRDSQWFSRAGSATLLTIAQRF